MNPQPIPNNASPLQSMATIDFSLEEGVRLALEVEEGKPSAFVRWLANHPQLASDLANFLAAERDLINCIAPRRHCNTGNSQGIRGLTMGVVLGEGGMGIVHRAYDPQLRRDVAVKRLKGDSISTTKEWARFQFEAEAVAMLDHPNIVPIYAYGEEEGAPYIVMPLLEGGTLAQRLRQLGPERRVAPLQAAEWLYKIALAVHHAHQRGLLHRDLKPGNILFDAAGEPHIADFGLARRLDAHHSLSATDSIVGTAAYMAPEQARGQKGLTTAADVHALGAILYELLTGAPPYGSGELLATLKRVVEEEPASVRLRCPAIPADIEAICMKCLEKNPNDRYRSALAFADDLDRFIHGQSVEARMPGLWDWVRQLARVRPHPNISWPVPIWIGFWLIFTQIANTYLCRNDYSALWIWASNGICAMGMFVAIWWNMLRRFREIPVTERHSIVVALGHILAHGALMVGYVPFSNSAPASTYYAVCPAIMALSGLGLFILGSTNWSRMFWAGMIIIAMTPLLIRWPEEAPLLFGIPNGLMMWYWTFAKYRYFHDAPVDRATG